MNRRGVPSFGAMMLIAPAVLALPALLIFSAGLTRLRRDYRLAHDGAIVEGKVDRFELVTYSTTSPGSGSSIFSSGGGSRTVKRVHYSFRAADKVVYQNDQTPTSPFVRGLSVGGPVSVRYVRSDPDISEIESRPLTAYLFTAMGTMSLALVTGVFVFGLRQMNWSGGKRGFSECTATVTELEEANTIVDSVTWLHVRFQFSDAAGNDHWGKSPPLAPEEARAHAVGSRVRIRYKASDPSITRWLE